MNLHLFLASLAATLSLGIAAQASPAKVACVGDSITFGSGLKPCLLYTSPSPRD